MLSERNNKLVLFEKGSVDIVFAIIFRSGRTACLRGGYRYGKEAAGKEGRPNSGSNGDLCGNSFCFSFNFQSVPEEFRCPNPVDRDDHFVDPVGDAHCEVGTS